MVEKIVGLFISLFSGIQGIPFGKELIVFLISLMPILELIKFSRQLIMAIYF